MAVLANREERGVWASYALGAMSDVVFLQSSNWKINLKVIYKLPTIGSSDHKFANTLVLEKIHMYTQEVKTYSYKQILFTVWSYLILEYFKSL